MSGYLPQNSAYPEPPPPPFEFKSEVHPTSSPYGSPQPSQLQQHDPRQAATSNDGKARLRKACDSCSIRKVRCDESGPPCRSCAALDIPCTFSRPSRRRGPPNRHAEAIKRRNLGTGGSQSGGSLPDSPIEATAHVLTSLSSQPSLSAESICPLPVLQLLIDDFFTYIHPLIPIPHEPTFRAAFARREDLTSCQFLALLASMIGALVASFPRKPRQHLSADMAREFFPSSMSLVDRCHRIAVDARGPGYLDRELSVYDAATSYFIALLSAYTYNISRMRLYLHETVGIMRALDIHKGRQAGLPPSTPSTQDPTSSNGSSPQDLPQPTNYITQELGRRLFYVLLAGIMTLQQLGSNDGILLMPPPTPADPYPPFPLEIDDAYIFSTHIEPQPQGLISEITGFNANVRVYSSYHSLTRVEMAYGIDEVFDWDRQKRVLDQCLLNVKSALDSVPEELMLRPGHRIHSPDQSQYTDPLLQQSQSQHPYSPRATARRKVAYEIQKANIYASQLGTRSYLVEKYWALHEAHSARHASFTASQRFTPNTSVQAVTPQSPYSVPYKPGPGSASHSSPGAVAAGLDSQLQLPTTTQNDMAEERENIIRELLVLLRTISQVDMEPNGSSFVNKIRQIASTLLFAQSRQPTQSNVASQASMYLSAFLDILMKLERLGDGGSTNSEEELEEQELRTWADMKDLQRAFAEKGGFFGLL